MFDLLFLYMLLIFIFFFTVYKHCFKENYFGRRTCKTRLSSNNVNLYPPFPSHSYTLAVRFHSYLAAAKKKKRKPEAVTFLHYVIRRIALPFFSSLGAYLEPFALV